MAIDKSSVALFKSAAFSRAMTSASSRTIERYLPRNRRPSWYWAISVALVALAVFTTIMLQNRRGGDKLQKVALALEPLDLGELWAQDLFVRDLALRNLSVSPIRIIGFETDCRCATLSPESVGIPAGGTVPVSLSLVLSDHGRLRDVEKPTRLRVTIKSVTKDGHYQIFTLTGHVKAPIVPSDFPVTLKPETVPGYEKAVGRIELRVHKQVAGISAHCSGSNFGVETLESSLGNYALTIKSNSQCKAGIVDQRLHIQPVSISGQNMPKLSIPIRGEVRSKLLVIPMAVQLRRVAARTEGENDEAAQVITVQSRARAPIGECQAKIVNQFGATRLDVQVSLDREHDWRRLVTIRLLDEVPSPKVYTMELKAKIGRDNAYTRADIPIAVIP